ncbi:uncharacterized protein LOC129658234 isoform X2 [Bubalus kerabau]|uniref:uncharacterized protein LOC129658234 isoform X2 n=1 Tax=Bubalus carabanensis TaxID=3119969 RepID=UPI00244E9E61|nr:uncharacterized protein LOC129658234 isoform X2 [Bubalus carabanensis]XP_055445336.1 uncharacterized protein LOC129658234 isoform X2 [Bubalus carabanensis]XP_055445337.1 uncharacterized protein LOC129658234 isoform X2 [Bubalus carabanensis]XP_055445338.1 uncharacterized protein LOC129658234 isoform X2 [Bubalus carabanensis]
MLPLKNLCIIATVESHLKRSLSSVSVLSHRCLRTSLKSMWASSPICRWGLGQALRDTRIHPGWRTGNPGGRGFSDVSGGSALNPDASGPLPGGHLRVPHQIADRSGSTEHPAPSPCMRGRSPTPTTEPRPGTGGKACPQGTGMRPAGCGASGDADWRRWWATWCLPSWAVTPPTSPHSWAPTGLLAPPSRCWTFFIRYGCILPYCDEDGGPLHQLKMAMASILGTWLHLCPEDFQQSPEFPCLKMLLAYVELNMPNSNLEQ